MQLPPTTKTFKIHGGVRDGRKGNKYRFPSFFHPGARLWMCIDWTWRFLRPTITAQFLHLCYCWRPLLSVLGHCTRLHCCCLGKHHWQNGSSRSSPDKFYGQLLLPQLPVGVWMEAMVDDLQNLHYKTTPSLLMPSPHNHQLNPLAISSVTSQASQPPPFVVFVGPSKLISCIFYLPFPDIRTKPGRLPAHADTI